jgi:hypothetical protein
VACATTARASAGSRRFGRRRVGSEPRGRPTFRRGSVPTTSATTGRRAPS